MNLTPRVDETTDGTNENGGNTAKGDRGVEEDETADGERELVEGTNHGVGGGRGAANTPGSAVRDEDGTETRVDHAEEETVAALSGEVAGKVLAGPILKQEGADNQDGDSEGVVVEHGYFHG